MWDSVRTREEAIFLKTMMGIPSDSEYSEESRLSRVILTISGVNLTSLISAGVWEVISGFSPSSIVKTEEK